MIKLLQILIYRDEVNYKEDPKDYFEYIYNADSGTVLSSTDFKTVFKCP